MSSVWMQYTEMVDHVAVVRPDLVNEARSYSTQPAANFSSFLNRHFPIPDGWNNQSIDTAADVLKQHYPAK